MGAGASTRQKPLVFLVDDDGNMLRALRIVLSSTYTVESSSDPTLAVQFIRDHHPDVIILDIAMPGHDGFWVLQQVRAFDAQVPVIVNSAHQDLLGADEAHAIFTPFAYLHKNGDFKQFMQIVGNAAKAAGW